MWSRSRVWLESGKCGDELEKIFLLHDNMIADIYISISMETFEHRKYKIRGDDGND